MALNRPRPGEESTQTPRLQIDAFSWSKIALNGEGGIKKSIERGRKTIQNKH